MPWHHGAMTDMPQVSVRDLDDDAVILDVREQDEWDAGHAPNAVHLPLSSLPARVAEVPRDRQVDVTCKAGGRSARAVAFLRDQGVDARNVEGGMMAWEAAGKKLVADQGEPTVI